jgi:hypothetical protein
MDGAEKLFAAGAVNDGAEKLRAPPPKLLLPPPNPPPPLANAIPFRSALTRTTAVVVRVNRMDVSR